MSCLLVLNGSLLTKIDPDFLLRAFFFFLHLLQALWPKALQRVPGGLASLGLVEQPGEKRKSRHRHATRWAFQVS